ncbi:unnamed protein product [Peniophora sp. CBMAI 1063]|nr:unnamed protein product [Peniophora sp. CBMAI 1063]
MSPDSVSLDVPKPRFRYMEDPRTYRRNFPVAQYPGIGDFVVFAIDPVASVAHLDKVARRAAKKIQTSLHVGLIMMMNGLPIENIPVNQFRFVFLRKGLPPTTPPSSFADSCIPVLPNTHHPMDCQPLAPLHPLPWDDCYISSTEELHFRSLRVKNTPRDYTPVLPVTNYDELWRLECTIDDSKAVEEERMRRIQEGSLDAIAAIPIPVSPSSTLKTALPSTRGASEVPEAADDASLSSGAPSNASRLADDHDDVSMIGSVDEDGSENHAKQTAMLSDDVDLGILHHFESMIDSRGSVNNPVVDIWYDLNMVKDVGDISLFLDECAQIRRIIDDAEERLGIRAAREAAAAQKKEFYARLAQDAHSIPDHRKGGLIGGLSNLVHAALRAAVCHSPGAHYVED